MNPKLEILSGEQWYRLLAFAADLPGVNHDGNATRLGIRLKNILVAAGWTQFLSTDYDRACTVISEHYAAKLTAPPAMTEEQAFIEGGKLIWYSAAVLIQMARLAHEHRHNDQALRGFSKAYGRSAKHMATAVEYWPEWFDPTQPRAQTAQECLILFALASLPKDQATASYFYWRDHLSLSYFDLLEYVAEIKAQLRRKDFEQYTAHRRETLRGLGRMKKTAGNGKLEVIQGVIETVKDKL